MTNVTAKFEKNKIKITSSGHCSHDVCVAVSACISGIVQYCMCAQTENKLKINNQTYAYGNVEIKIECKEEYVNDVSAEIKALLIIADLYAHNFPEDVTFEIVSGTL